MKKRIKTQGLILLAVWMAGVNLTGCASRIAREIISQIYEDGKDGKAQSRSSGEDNDNAKTQEEKENQEQDVSETEGVFQSYEQFIQEELEPRLGTAKNTQFSYGFEKIVYEGSGGWFASPMRAGLENGIISTYRRDLDKDGKDELLVAYIEGSRQGKDGMNHFCLDIYGDRGNGFTSLGTVSFDDCFSGYNGEEHMFGLKDLGSKYLIYAGGNGSVWTWADGVDQEIRLYQLESSGINEIFRVENSGSDYSWMDGWKRQLQGYGFDLPDLRWDECNLAGESGFEILAYGECSTQSGGKGYGSGFQQELLDTGSINGGIYGPDSQIVMQMNQTMRPYGSGGNSYAGGTAGTYPSGNSGSAAYTAGDYILPNSSTMYLSSADLAGLSDEQLRLARNEIYARHGRKFKTKEIQDYFNSKSWYSGTIESDAFKDSYLNIYEKENIKLIQRMEKQ